MINKVIRYSAFYKGIKIRHIRKINDAIKLFNYYKNDTDYYPPSYSIIKELKKILN